VQIDEDWHDEKLLDTLINAAEVIPREPKEAPASMHSILQRWQQRTGVSVRGRDAVSGGTWEVMGRSYISVNTARGASSSCPLRHMVKR
jgi:hypothetical protein